MPACSLTLLTYLYLPARRQHAIQRSVHTSLRVGQMRKLGYRYGGTLRQRFPGTFQRADQTRRGEMGTKGGDSALPGRTCEDAIQSSPVGRKSEASGLEFSRHFSTN